MRPAISRFGRNGDFVVFGGGPWQCLEATHTADDHDGDLYRLRIDVC
jgi:hypothetical protein